jgi:AbiJ N-terminal domain 4
METMEIFSERQHKSSEKAADFLIYDDLPKEFRVQVIYIVRETLGSREDYCSHNPNIFKSYECIVKVLRKAHGKYIHLVHENPRYNSYENYIEELEEFLLTEKNVNKTLDAIEIAFRIIDIYTRNASYLYRPDADTIASEAIDELNLRFKRYNIGYQFENGQILKVNSLFMHEEAIKPALKLLQDPKYAGAEEEFIKAHTHYRNNNLKESINECLKAFESTMKIICKDYEWDFPDNATAKKLIDVCFDNELIPNYWQSHFTTLRCFLESGVPTGRNKESGHGQGSEIKEVPTYLASGVINMTATAILILVGAATYFKKR